jgi:hypothetical protein
MGAFWKKKKKKLKMIELQQFESLGEGGVKVPLFKH